MPFYGRCRCKQVSMSFAFWNHWMRETRQPNPPYLKNREVHRRAKRSLLNLLRSYYFLYSTCIQIYVGIYIIMYKCAFTFINIFIFTCIVMYIDIEINTLHTYIAIRCAFTKACSTLQGRGRETCTRNSPQTRCACRTFVGLLESLEA